MSRKTQEQVRLNATLNIRLTLEEKHQMKEDAYLASLTVSQLVRKRYFGRRVSVNPNIQILKELRRVAEILNHFGNLPNGPQNIQLNRTLEYLAKTMGKVGSDS